MCVCACVCVHDDDCIPPRDTSPHQDSTGQPPAYIYICIYIAYLGSGATGCCAVGFVGASESGAVFGADTGGEDRADTGGEDRDVCVVSEKRVERGRNLRWRLHDIVIKHTPWCGALPQV